MDDTLFDYAAADRAGMRAHLAAEGLAGLHGTVEEALIRWKELTELYWRRFEERPAGNWQEQRRWRVRDFLDRREMTDPEADAWFGRYVAHYEAAWELFPDALPVLDLLAAEYRQGVLSNSSIHAQEPKLRALGVRDHFEAVLCAAELGSAKPAAEAFHAACAAFGLAPHEVAYVGDRPDIDALGAREAGLHGIWLDRAGTGGQPGLHRITDLHQLPPLLRGDTRFGAPSTFG
ncbi:HAD family hydrolase [Streptomyces roseolus]|uniref:HAD family hydrolase n=1 Tax=Streptomyces roseolus TaxID=67358 RepID=UPI00365F3682